jgi:flagellar protein FliO/FliZ
MSRPTVVHRSRWSTLALVAGAALSAHLLLPALALADRASESTPVNLGGDADAAPAHVGGGSFARVIAGLFVVVAAIYGVTWLLKRLKGVGGTGSGRSGAMEAVSSLALAGGGTLHLVRVGDELLLVGSGSQGATTLRGWEVEEAIAQGLLPAPAGGQDGHEDGGDGPADGDAGSGGNPRRPAGPSSAAPLAGAGRRLLDRLRALTVRS